MVKMANIVYKSEEEQNIRSDFNPYQASREELEMDLKQQFKLLTDYRNKFYDFLDEEHADRIFEGTVVSSPFSKTILSDDNVKAVDEVRLQDFDDEKTFKKVLEWYYCYLRILQNTYIDNKVLRDKYSVDVNINDYM